MLSLDSRDVLIKHRLSRIFVKVKTDIQTRIQTQVIYDILYDPNRRQSEVLLRKRAGKLVSLYHSTKFDDDIHDENYQQ